MRDRKYLIVFDALPRGTVSATSNDDPMAITMKNYGIRWINADGVPQASAVSYDQASADDRKARLEAGGATDVAIVETKPGELLEPAS